MSREHEVLEALRMMGAGEPAELRRVIDTQNAVDELHLGDGRITVVIAADRHDAGRLRLRFVDEAAP